MRPASRARLRKLGFLWAGEPQELTQGAVRAKCTEDPGLPLVCR